MQQANKDREMCILFLYYCDNPSPDGYRLIIASNRDEFYFRPTASAKFWDKNPNIIAGMDLEPGKEGGTWLGMNKDGKFASITNYRQAPKFTDPNATGRGHLVPDFLEGDGNVQNYLANVSSKAHKYNGFNLLVGKLSLTGESSVGWYCNIEQKVIKMLNPGIHVLSNKVLNCSWPKMVYGRERFAGILNKTYTKRELTDQLIELLSVRDRSFSCGDDKSFIGPQDEGGNMNAVNACRAIFVNYKEQRYGTRTNTVVLVDASGHVTYVERTMEDNATDPDIAEWRLTTHEFDIQDNTDDTIAHVTMPAKENLQNGSTEQRTTKDEQLHIQKHAKKRPLTNGTRSHVEPAEKITVKQ